MLFRKIPAMNTTLHKGGWNKSAVGSYEVRGKKLGIIGYGHIGTQIGILAEALGMHVYYYDIEAKLPLGNATAVNTLQELLSLSDAVTLHAVSYTHLDVYKRQVLSTLIGRVTRICVEN